MDVHAQLERLLAKEQVTEALLAYARGVDRLDLDLIRSVFHPGPDRPELPGPPLRRA